MARTDAPGWYGKLPSLGDFASRRLSPLFVEPWDRWLASGLAAWRERDEGWLDAFLAGPTWRFALGAGVPFAASRGYAGVLMPSVDRVGRYFPLTVVRPRTLADHETPGRWLAAVEHLAVTALHDDWNADRFDTELASIEDADDSGPAWPDVGHTSWWYERDGETLAPIVLAGLPDGVALALLFAGRAGELGASEPKGEPT